MADWEPVVGLEIHVHLKTRTKMFCRCELEYFAEPNTRTCPVCLAHPGALPVANRLAVEWTIKLGLALGCEIAEEAVFSRKNYFYPDNPKGYQISQYDQPLCVGGSLLVPGADGDREIGFVRAHLEEDAAKTIHVGGATGRKVGSGALAHRLQPRRHAARRDRHAAGHPLRRRGRALPATAAPDDRRARDLRRGDGEGHAARRRERLRPAGRQRRAAHALGAEEHELVHVHRPRHRRGGARPDRRVRRRAPRSSSTRTTTSRTATG